MFALKYAMTQLKCCKKDKAGEAIKEVLVIEEVCMFFEHAACFQQQYKLLDTLFLTIEYSLIPKLIGRGSGSGKSVIHTVYAKHN